jgi:hypothetical protein
MDVSAQQEAFTTILDHQSKISFLSSLNRGRQQQKSNPTYRSQVTRGEEMEKDFKSLFGKTWLELSCGRP